MRENIGQNMSTLQEGIAGVRVIQAYAREPEQTRRFVAVEPQPVRLARPQRPAWRRGTSVSSRRCGIFATALVIGIGGWLVNRGDISIGTVIAAVLLLAQLFEPVQQLSQLYNTVQSSTAALNKLFGILDTEPDVVGGPARAARDRATSRVDAVGFTYPGTDTPVLSGVSIDGRRRGAAGARRADRRRQVDARQADGPAVRPDRRARSRFGGVDLRDADLDQLRHRIVVVPQEGFLFGGTIADNVRIARAGAIRRRRAQRAGRDRCARPVRRVRAGHPHRGARTRFTPVGRRAAAGVAGPGRAGRPGRAGARRGDEQPRPGHRGDRRAGARPADDRAGRRSWSPTACRRSAAPIASP